MLHLNQVQNVFISVTELTFYSRIHNVLWMSTLQLKKEYKCCFFQVHHGIKGMVYDENNNVITNAEISVAGVNHDVTNGKKGLGSVNYHHT